MGKRRTKSDNAEHFAEAAHILAADSAFIDLLASAPTAEGNKAVSDALVACLESCTAPEAKTFDPIHILSNFTSFCTSPTTACVSAAIGEALKSRRQKKNRGVESRRLLVFKSGLNWKSPLQEVRRKNLEAQMQKLTATELGEPYPPEGYYVAENDAIFNLWSNHLATCKMRDDRTSRHPVHILNPDDLLHDLSPDRGGIFDDGDGRAFQIYSLLLADEF